MKRPWIPFLLLAAGYVCAAAYWLPRVRGHINPDGISYLSLAERWLGGDFAEALSGHWGPMFSWLLVPLLFWRIEPLLACQIQTFATGLATLFAAWLWSGRFTQMIAVRFAVCAALVPLLLAWAATAVSPDLLVVCFLTYYAYFVSDPTPGRRSTILSAVFGALTYLAKSYGFVFFAVHFTLVSFARWIAAERGPRRREVVHRFVLGGAVFLALGLPWASALSVKYGRLTFGTAAAYNFGLVGPANGPVGTQAHPMDTQGLLPPPNDHAVSAWDDPSGMHFPPWPSFEESMEHLRALIVENTFHLYDVVHATSVVIWILLAAVLMVMALQRGRGRQPRLLVATVASATLYSAGFLPLLIEARYLWIVTIAALMLVAGLVDLFAQRFGWRGLPAALVAGAIAISFVINSNTAVPLPGESERASARIARVLTEQGIDLRGERLASDDQWGGTLFLSYFLKAQYFGVVLRGDPVKARLQLDQHRIEAFLLWGHQPIAPPYLEGFHKVAEAPAGERFALYKREL